MSTPENPLNRFNSYSYHHILLAANSTEILDAIKLNDFPVSSIVGRPRSEYLIPKQIDKVDGDYVIILDGTKDADFFIESLNWETVLAPSYGAPGAPPSFSTIGVEGKMTIREPRNIRFMNHLKQALDKIQCDAVGCCFIVKTIFVGYSEESSQPEIVSNIAPFGFTMVDLVGSFDASGGTYEIEMVGVVNGAGKLPQVANVLAMGHGGIANDSYLGGSVSITNELGQYQVRGNDLTILFQNLLTGVQDRYDEFFKETYKATKVKRRAVLYQILLDKAYNGYKADDSSIRAAGVVVFPKNATMEQAIDAIMQSSTRVQQEADPEIAYDGTTPSSWLYKIHVIVKSNVEASSSGAPSSIALGKEFPGFNPLVRGSTIDPSRDGKTGDYRIIYKIVRYEQPGQSSSSSLRGITADQVEALKSTTLELDYIYTGKNVDVLEFDMKMDTALMFLLTLRPIKIGGSNEAPSFVSGSVENESLDNRQYTPLFPYQNISNPSLTPTADPAAKLKFQAAMNKHATIAAMDAKVKIRGNPNLLNDISRSAFDVEQDRIQDKQQNEGVGLYVRRPDQAIGDWHTTPALIKLNIRMPTQDSDTFVTEPFWYEGLYQIFAISNMFEGGEFSQTIDMMALPQITEAEIQMDKLMQAESKAAALNSLITTQKGIELVDILNAANTDLGGSQ